jgi:hypothetical protein
MMMERTGVVNGRSRLATTAGKSKNDVIYGMPRWWNWQTQGI